MGNHDAFARGIAVPTLFLAVLENEELVAVQVARDAQGFVGRGALLVPHGQGVVGAGIGGDQLNPTHEILLVGRVARRREAVVVVAAHAHDVPVAQAVVVAVARVVEVGQSQAVAELVGKRADAVDGGTVIVAAIQLVEHGKVIHNGVAAAGTEGTIAARAVIVCRRQAPVAGPNGLGMDPRSLGLAHAGIDDDDHVAVVVVVGVIGRECHTVGCRQLAGLGHQPSQPLVIVVALVTAVVLAVL